MIFARNCSSRRSWSKIGRHDVNHGHPCEDFVLPNHSTFNPFEHYSDRLLGMMCTLSVRPFRTRSRQ